MSGPASGPDPLRSPALKRARPDDDVERHDLASERSRRKFRRSRSPEDRSGRRPGASSWRRSLSPGDRSYADIASRGDFWRPGHRDERDYDRSKAPATHIDSRSKATERKTYELSKSPDASVQTPATTASSERAPLRITQPTTTNEQRFSDFESLRHSNLSWKASQEQMNDVAGKAPGDWRGESRLSSAPLAAAAWTGPPSRRVVNHNGLTNVPTGPKSAGKIGTSVPKHVASAVRQKPHIFIPKSSVPVQPKTVLHLRNLLKLWIKYPSDIDLDESGYYLRFDATEGGRKLLDGCYKQHNGSRFFSMYDIEMIRYPNGQPSEYGATTTASERLTGNISACEQSAPQTNADHISADTRGPNATTIDMTVARGTPKDVSHIARSSSPTQFRRADSSSSTSSISSKSECHVCRKLPSIKSESKAKSLVQCSTCPRRYHPGCDLRSPMPKEQAERELWQCQRCVVKRLPPLQRQSSPTTPGLPVAESDGTTPQLSKPRTDTKLAETSLSDTPVNKALLPSSLSSRVEYTPNSGRLANPSLHTQAKPVKPRTASDEIEKEANDLVEESFKLRPHGEATRPTKLEPLKLRLQRKRLEKAAQSPLDRMTAPVPLSSNGMTGGIEPNENQSESQPPPSKKKPHRWSGGGADRAVIEAGRNAGFGFDEEPGNDQQSERRHSKLISKPPVSSSNGTGNAVDLAAPDPSLTKALGTTFDPTSKESATGDIQPETLQSNTGAPRIKPSTRRRAPCASCGKEAGYDPTASKILCVSCKRDLADLSKRSDDVIAASTHANQTSVPKLKEPTQVSAAGVLSRKSSSSAAMVVRSKSTSDHQKTSDEAAVAGVDLWDPPTTPQGHDVNMTEPIRSRKFGKVEANDGQVSIEADPEHDARKKPRKPRVSQTIAATSKHDLGNWNKRPPRTYEKLIGMAMLAMRGTPITNARIATWVADNIPGYTRREGTNWESGLTATMSMKQQSAVRPGATSYWKSLGPDPDAKGKNAQHLWELLPGAEAALLHWDPVLKEPVSPDRSSVLEQEEVVTPVKKAQRGRSADHAAGGNKPGGISTTALLGKPAAVKGRQSQAGHDSSANHALKTAANSATRANQSRAVSSASSTSSDEAPLIRRRRKVTASPSKGQSTRYNMDAMEVDTPPTEEETAPPAALRQQGELKAEQSDVVEKQRDTDVKHDFRATNIARLREGDGSDVVFSALSLFGEYPELDPTNAFDEEVKIAEIMKRPSRKHKIGTQQLHEDPWSRWVPKRSERSRADTKREPAEEPSFRAARKTALEHVVPDGFEGIVQEVESFEELLGLPSKPVAALGLEGQLLFRDGSSTRSRKMFEVGYV